MERGHRRIMALSMLDRARRERAARIAGSERKMEHPLKRERRQDRKVRAE